MIFDDEKSVQACINSDSHEVNGTKIKVSQRTKGQGKQLKESHTMVNQVQVQLNQAGNIESQLDIIHHSFLSVSPATQANIERVIELLKLKCSDFFELTFELIGSAKIGLLKDGSDIDMVAIVKQKEQKSFIMEGFAAQGEESVRKKGTDVRLQRNVSKLLFTLAGCLIDLAKSNRSLNLGAIHAVPGARKPLIRMSINNVKIELSINNYAAIANTVMITNLMNDQKFAVLVKVVRYIFGLNEITRIGRFSSYAVICLIIQFLTESKILEPLGLSKLEGNADITDELCSVNWDYRQPIVNLQWKQGQDISVLLKEFSNFISWLPFVQTGVVYDTR